VRLSTVIHTIAYKADQILRGTLEGTRLDTNPLQSLDPGYDNTRPYRYVQSDTFHDTIMDHPDRSGSIAVDTCVLTPEACGQFSKIDPNTPSAKRLVGGSLCDVQLLSMDHTRLSSSSPEADKFIAVQVATNKSYQYPHTAMVIDKIPEGAFESVMGEGCLRSANREKREETEFGRMSELYGRVARFLLYTPTVLDPTGETTSSVPAPNTTASFNEISVSAASRTDIVPRPTSPQISELQSLLDTPVPDFAGFGVGTVLKPHWYKSDVVTSKDASAKGSGGTAVNQTAIRHLRLAHFLGKEQSEGV
jgi:hypothetical protein